MAKLSSSVSTIKIKLLISTIKIKLSSTHVGWLVAILLQGMFLSSNISTISFVV